VKKVGILFLFLFLALGVFSQSFKDVPINHWAYDAVERLSGIGIIEGYPDGTFKGLENMNRYQLTVALSRTIDYVEQSMVAPLAQNLANLERTVRSLSVPQGVSSSELQQLQTRLDAATSDLSNLKGTVSRLDNSVKELQNSYELLGYATTKIDELERRVNSISVPAVSETDIRNLNTRVTNLENTVGSLNSNYQNLSQTVSNSNQEIQSLKNSVASIQNSFSSVNQDLDRLNALTANLNSKIDSKVDKTEFTSLKNTTDELSVQLSNNTQSVSELSQNLQAVQSSVDQLSQEVTDVKQIAEGAGGGVNFLDIIISVVISAGLSFAIMNLL
jgi:chromosome segregation ATPase